MTTRSDYPEGVPSSARQPGIIPPEDGSAGVNVEGTLAGISGRMMLTIREAMGWKRPDLSEMLRKMESKGVWPDHVPTSVASILRYERDRVVKVRYVRRLRFLVGAELFDAMVAQMRNGRMEQKQSSSRRCPPRTMPRRAPRNPRRPQ